MLKKFLNLWFLLFAYAEATLFRKVLNKALNELRPRPQTILAGFIAASFARRAVERSMEQSAKRWQRSSRKFFDELERNPRIQQFERWLHNGDPNVRIGQALGTSIGGLTAFTYFGILDDAGKEEWRQNFHRAIEKVNNPLGIGE
jgi:hypothetical protein